MERRKKVIIDLDTGVDDAQALIMSLSQSDTVDVIAVTCVAGNTSLDNAYNNTLRVLQACNRLDIPVYRGCSSPFLGDFARDASGFHGRDGLGDVEWSVSPPSASPIQDEHAAVAINRLVDMHPGEVTLVALGPLTNVGLALKLSPKMGLRLRELVIMGGNMPGRKPVEFNFVTDPEAAHIVVSQIGLGADRFFLVPIETCSDSDFDWEWTNAWMSTDTEVGRFHRMINRANLAFRHHLGRSSYSTCDPCAMLVAITSTGSMDAASSHPAVTGSVRWKASVELRDVESRGQLRGEESHEANVTLVTSLDRAMYKEFLVKMLEQKSS